MFDQLLTPSEGQIRLTDAESMFVYQMEVIGLPANRAAEVAGVASPYALLKRPHIIAAREQARLAVRGRTNFTREDVVAGLKEAIDQAKVMADPMAQIAGWREMAKILGYDKTPNVHLHMSGTVDGMRRQISAMSTEDLMRQMEDPTILDGDFYKVDDHPEAPK